MSSFRVSNDRWSASETSHESSSSSTVLLFSFALHHSWLDIRYSSVAQQNLNANSNLCISPDKERGRTISR